LLLLFVSRATKDMSDSGGSASEREEDEEVEEEEEPPGEDLDDEVIANYH
jgi:hypothetical protein